jgi:hypothetical protein
MKETLGGTGGSQSAVYPARPGIGVWQLPERFVRRAQGVTLTRFLLDGAGADCYPRDALAGLGRWGHAALPPQGLCRQRGALASQERADVEGDERSAAAGMAERRRDSFISQNRIDGGVFSY